MTAVPRAAAHAWLERFDAKSERHGLAYPWWIAIASHVMLVSCLAVALVQRDLVAPPSPILWVAALVVLPDVLQGTIRAWVPWWCAAAITVGGVAWIMAASAPVDPTLDLAPAVLAVPAARLTATDGWRAGVATMAAGIAAVVLVGSPSGTPLTTIVFGFLVGCMLRWLMRALTAERAARASERERATVAERERLAREVHDLVAHSLSVTLLHVAGARQALLDDDEDDALAALTDAERVGRGAMADIRATVRLLSRDAAHTRALPDASDLDSLVDELRKAGLAVDWRTDGDLGGLDRATGLGLYRVLQESLTNVARHAPGAAAEARVEVDADQVRLTVVNPCASAPRGDGLGSGVEGMRARAAQLGGSLQAGPDGARWRVSLTVPRRDAVEGRPDDAR
ncbi:MAG: histidine kinase [Aeromicrobium sp.]|uniref:sensor histidine kinase n=1 Tax=Aeromicrobium sp. TaxID=1871063 RepID=UPI0039E31C53